MRAFIIGLFFLLFTGTTFSQINDSIRYSVFCKDKPFAEFAEEIERNENLVFFYRNEWIDTLNVTINVEDVSINELLKKILDNPTLGFVMQPPNKIFILPDNEFVLNLPNYLASMEDQDIDNDVVEEIMLTIEKKYLKGREPDMVGTIIIGERNKMREGTFAVINGKVTEEESGDPIIGATLYLKDINVGAATDVDGFLNVALLPGQYSALFQSLGMKNLKCILDVRSDGYFAVSMKKEVTSIAEVTVNANKSLKRGSKVGLERVSIKSVKELPTLMGEKDIIKISQMLPGVVSVSEGSGGVNVRGGNADQNLFYLNQVPVYNTSHLFGFFSAINSTIIKDFSLHKGHVPVEFGGRLSSVFNVETRKGSKKRFFAQGGISPISANFEIEAPLVKDKCAFMLSGRSSYSEWILNRLKDPALRNSNARFYDFAGAIDYEINPSNSLSIFAYHSNDFFSLDKLTDYEYSNTGTSVNYDHRFSPRLKSSIVLTSSNYSFSTTEKSNGTESYQHKYSLNHSEFSGNISYVRNEKHTLKAGAKVILYQLDRGKVSPFGAESIRVPIDLGNELGVESALYIDDQYTVTPWLNLYGGVRFSNFSQYGPKKVLNYLPDGPLDERNISDTLYFDSGDKIVNYNGPEFRFASDIKLGNFSSFKLSYTQMRQYMFMLSNTISISPSDQWKMVDYHIIPPKSNQFSAGVYKIFPGFGLSTSTEVYYKFAKNIVEYKDGADFISTPNVETVLLQGDQKAYGLELMVSKDEGKFNGWISYAYSRSLITVDDTKDYNKINDGKTFPSNYDKPHVLNVIANYKFNRRFTLSSNVSYSTGRPITLPQGIFYIDNKPYVDYSGRNEYRIPDYFRIDMSLTVEGNLKAKKLFHSYWLFSVYNLTGRKNPTSVYFKSEEGKIKGYQYSIIGVPIFTISWNFKLGNYANN